MRLDKTSGPGKPDYKFKQRAVASDATRMAPSQNVNRIKAGAPAYKAPAVTVIKKDPAKNTKNDPMMSIIRRGR